MTEIRLQLEESAYEPGSEVRGTVEWFAEPDEVPESVVVSLLFHTAGKGTEDIEIVDRREVEATSRQGSLSFSLRLPDFPWSFSGRLISLLWAVEASLEPKGGVDRLGLVSAPGGEEITL